MRSGLEQRIRECYDSFLDIVTDDQDLWKIALLEYYCFPLEDWSVEQENEWEYKWGLDIPSCFEDLVSEVSRLVKYKNEVCPDDDFCTVQRCLELDYNCGELFLRPSYPLDRLELPAEAVALLLEYYLLVEILGDTWGNRPYRSLFDETSDETALSYIVSNNIHTPEQEKTLALQINAVYDQWDISHTECAWMFKIIEELLENAVLRGCAEAGWKLYEILVEKELLDDISDPIWLLYTAAEAGSAEAQLEIGRLFLCHTEGRVDSYEVRFCGGDITAEKAVHYLEQALRYKSEAGYIMMRLFRNGWGVEVNEERAIRCCRIVAETHYEGIDYYQLICISYLAYYHASGRDVPKDTPRNPRAAVQWWIRDTCLTYDIECYYWNFRMGIWSAEDCPDHLRWLKEPSVDAFLGDDAIRIKKGTYWWLENNKVWCGREDLLLPYNQMPDLLNQERVRLLYDAAQNGDENCDYILKKLLENGTATQEMLEQLTPGKYGVYDWSDVWYKEALNRIECKMYQKN